MTPSPSAAAVCGGCFLYERSGVCSTARDAYDLQNSAEAQRRAYVLHAAVLQDAGTVPSLAGLVRLEARQYPAGLAAASRLGLLVAPNPLSPNSRKDAARVAIPRTVR